MAHSKISMKKALLLAVLLLFALVLGGSSALALSQDDCLVGEVYFAPLDDCFEPKFNVEKTVFPVNQQTPSSISPIQINDPYGAVGQAVAIKLTVSNIGDEYGYPYNQIPLSPDMFAMTIAIDKDLGVIDKDGNVYDVWEDMTTIEKYSVVWKDIWDGAWNVLWDNAVQGKSCVYTDETDNLPPHIIEKIKEWSGSENPEVYKWRCIRLVDEATFENKLGALCPNDYYDAGCLAKAHNSLQGAMGDVILSSLSSDTKGQCEWKGTAGVNRWLSCGIGKNGLGVGESATFTFVMLIPADTPVVSPAELEATLGENLATVSASCLDEANPYACHGIYVAVSPMAKANLISFVVDRVIDGFQVAGCTFKTLFTGFQSDLLACYGRVTNSVDTAGAPIYEGQGIFYVVAPVLKAEITLILWLALIGGAMTTVALGRRK